MKAIKGLEDRLYALDQMIASCKKLVNEQKELAQVCQIREKRSFILSLFYYFLNCAYMLSPEGIFGQSEAG